MANTAGVLIHPEQAVQVRDFTGMRWGSITPMDLDGLIHFSGKVFIFIELKYDRAPLLKGQRIALEVLTDVISSTGKPSMSLVASHQVHEGDIVVADCMVTEYRFKRQWLRPHRAITVREAIDSFLEKLAPEEAHR